ncbi:MAG: alpha/beta hydrolase-fold protein [Lacrimispora sp.]|uniref:alpha/beta hydrolase n=1 Tax=Lacrimispora sp. TaxID=2719234 RepID=UPI0039E52C03
MAVFETKFFSESLLQDVTVSVILPLPTSSNMEFGDAIQYPGQKQKYQVIWLIPTGTADHSKNVRSSRIEEYAKIHQVAVITPNLHNSLGFNLPHGVEYFDFLTRELPTIMRSIYPISSRREDNFIGGASNGGFTGYMTALRNPHQYAAAFSIGSFLDIRKCRDNKHAKFWYEKVSASLFGENDQYYDPHVHDTKTLAEDLAASGKEQPKFYSVLGFEDPYYPEAVGPTKEISKILKDMTVIEEHGFHDWDFWDPQLRKVLEWLPLKRGFVE